MKHKFDLVIIVVIVTFLSLLLWLGHEIPQLGGPITAITESCDGDGCGSGPTLKVFPVILAVVVLIGLVALLIGTIGQRSRK